MPDLTLAGQYAQGRACLEAGEYARAQQITERILEAFPRCIDARLLLGLAALGQGRDDEAAQCFRRVLGADPERAEAHVGLATIYARRDNDGEAIVQLRRALDLDGRQTPVRQELRRLYRRNGVAMSRIPMTTAELARVRIKGYLFAGAIDLLEDALTAEPDRADLRATLAVARWQTGDSQGATRVAEALHERLPYALVANLILGQSWLDGEKDAEARHWLLRAQELDPQNARAQVLFGSGSPLPPRSPRLPYRAEDGPSIEEEQPYLAAIDAYEASPDTAERPVAGEAPAHPEPQHEVPALSAPDALPTASAADAPPSLDEIERRLAQRPEDVDAHLALARRLRDLGILDRALFHYRALADTAPERAPVLYRDVQLMQRIYARHEGIELLARRLQTMASPDGPSA